MATCWFLLRTHGYLPFSQQDSKHTEAKNIVYIYKEYIWILPTALQREVGSVITGEKKLKEMKLLKRERKQKIKQEKKSKTFVKGNNLKFCKVWLHRMKTKG